MWYNLMTDEERENTEFVINLSYGKDSLAAIHVAVDILKIPIWLIRIVHAEVWATDTIPADLPPMVEFKRWADGFIKGRWGLTVEHVCATRGGGNAPSVTPSTNCTSGESTSVSCEGSQCSVGRGVKTGSNGQPLEKLTFEKLFYHIPERKDPDNPNRGGVHRMALSTGTLVQQQTQSADQFWVSRHAGDHGATRISRGQPYGFPISSPNGGNWCTQLKKRVFPKPPAARGEEKYRPSFGHCGR